MDVIPRIVKSYVTPSGRDPFREWFTSLKDKKTQAIIDTRINRLAYGNFGDFKSIGEELLELRIFYGPGYRIYFTIEDIYIVLLLIGGTKSQQHQDI